MSIGDELKGLSDAEITAMLGKAVKRSRACINAGILVAEGMVQLKSAVSLETFQTASVAPAATLFERAAGILRKIEREEEVEKDSSLTAFPQPEAARLSDSTIEVVTLVDGRVGIAPDWLAQALRGAGLAEDEIVERYDCVIHGTGDGPNCPRC